MAYYDRFTISNASVSTTAGALGYNGSGTLTVPSRYRMILRGTALTNSGTVSALFTVNKVNSSATVAVISQEIAAGSSFVFGEGQDFIVESGYYLTALVSAGTGSVIAEGEFLPE